ncbi:MAG: hypothetical protein QXS90_00910 [Candidatus Diapherotrites archaeon]
MFTLIIFYACLIIIGLGNTKTNIEIMEKENNSIIQELQKAKEIFSNYSNGLIELPLSKQNSNVVSRLLPFSYEIDKNKAYLEIDFPNNAKINDYFEKINSLKIFYETKEKKPNNAVNIDINAPLPQSWGGNAKSIKFKIESCSLLSLDTNSFTFQNYCGTNYLEKVSEVEINLILNNIHDFNLLVCNFDNNTTCPTNEFQPNQSLPFIKLNISDENCTNCRIEQKQVSAFFDPSKENYLELKCQENCNSKPIKVSLKENVIIETNEKVKSKIKVVFKEEIEKIVSLDTNMSIYTNRVKIWKR